MPVFAEVLCEDLWLNGIKMTVESLEIQSEVLQQSLLALSVCICSESSFDIVRVMSGCICTVPPRFPHNEMSPVNQKWAY